jgi:hypothetical protein
MRLISWTLQSGSEQRRLVGREKMRGIGNIRGERKDAGGLEDQWREMSRERKGRSLEICRSEVSWQGKGRAATYRNCCLEFVYFLKREK